MTDESTNKDELHIIDNSSLNVFMTCARKFYYANTESITGEKESEALTAGSACHEYLEAMWAGKSRAECMDAFIAYIRKPESADLDIEINPETSGKRGGQKYSVEWLLFILGLYHKRFPLEDEEFEVVKKANGEPYLETGFALDLGGGKIFTGKIDAIVRMKKSGRLWIVDHKTTLRILNDFYFKSYSLHGQIAGYLWAVRELFGEEPEGCIINALRITQLKRGTVDALVEKIFSRALTYRTPAQLQEREYEVSIMMSVIASLAKQGKHAFYKNAPGGCNMYNRDCEYLPLCMSSDDYVHDEIRKANYVQREWTPHKPESAVIKEIKKDEKDKEEEKD